MVLLKDGYDVPVYGLANGMFYYVHVPAIVCLTILMVNVVAINVFAMMFFNINISFGKFDGGLLLWAFGVPFVGALIAAMLNQFGPMGVGCIFDAVNGQIANLVLTTIPMPTIMAINVLLYILTFIKIRTDVRAMKQSLGNMASTAGGHIRAARKMSMFLVAFFVQWFCFALFGAWSMFVDNPADIPEILNFIGVIFTNLGGVMNLIVYLLVFKKKRPRAKTDMTTNKAPRVLRPASAPSTSDINNSSTEEYAFN
ncbi:uncharacterized protein LOC128219235 [Mya arenaria]|uniref:uncharacterized protein LOC128219235 n=1 Tax=Mya arenaria TaxID=6604 RepID=UPI0022E5661C|nr:uncharacterized protein LOC128219235 [Mya arenaria]